MFDKNRMSHLECSRYGTGILWACRERDAEMDWFMDYSSFKNSRKLHLFEVGLLKNI